MFVWLEFRTYCHATEDEGKIAKVMGFLCDSAKPKVTKTEGYHKNPILVYVTRTNKPRVIRDFWRALAAHGLVGTILESLEDGMDDDGVLHFRLGKQEACRGKVVLSAHDDSVVVKLKVVAYPARRGDRIEKARKTIEEIVGSDASDA